MSFRLSCIDKFDWWSAIFESTRSMVQSYLRYEKDASFGVIASPSGNVLYDKTGTLAIVPALENVIVWNIKQGTQVHVLKGSSSQVSALKLSPDGSSVAVGYVVHDKRLLTR